MKTLIFIAVAFLVIALAGLISSKLKLDTPKSNASKAERKWDNDVAKYKNLIGKLPRVQRDEIHDLVYNTGMKLGVPSSEMPDELTKVLSATNALKKEGISGKTSQKQYHMVQRSISEFEKQMDFLLPSLRKALDNAYDKGGLDFGIITNSAADLALHSAMDKNEKQKSYNRMSISVNQNIDNEVVKLITKIEESLSK